MQFLSKNSSDFKKGGDAIEVLKKTVQFLSYIALGLIRSKLDYGSILHVLHIFMVPLHNPRRDSTSILRQTKAAAPSSGEKYQ